MTRAGRTTRGGAILAVAAALAPYLVGCSVFGGVRVETLDVSTQKPSNVAFYVSVTDHGEPVTDLEAKSFKVYENGQELSARLIDRTLLPRDAVTSERVLLLVDVSQNPSAAQRQNYAEAIEAFVRKLSPALPVAVRAFDGSPGLKTVGDYARGAQNPSAAAVTKLTSRDASRDLDGAILAGLAELDRTESDKKPIHLGTLVVFARGPDLAGRTDESKLDAALDATTHDVIAVGIGDDTPYLRFARGGVVHAQDADTLPIAFEEAGSRVAATHAKYYLVAYCSPARAGRREVRLEVTHEDEKGDAHSGSTEYDLDASGFGPGCRAETTPRFEHPAAAEKHTPSARVNQAPVEDPDAVVPPPSSGDYAK
ncbi:MAG TPA: hypothetical protein VMI54_11565 [Polyangiaceae bacterium]|nr:hypothetical protein [Polyangiaceae bacterium]